MQNKIQTISCALFYLGMLACGACSSDKKNDAGSSGKTGSLGDAAAADSGFAGHGGSSGNGSGNADGGGGNGGNGGSGANKDAGSDAGNDAGTDAGPPLLKCVAPKPAASSGNTCPAGNPVTLKATKIPGGTGFNFPVFVTHSPNDPEKRLFVVERPGSIKIIKNGAALSTAFLDVSVVSGMNEQGLLGLAFDPNYEATGRFWVDYIGQNGGLGTQSVVESYTISANPDVAAPSSKTPLLTLEDPEWNHNGGMLAFGQDNCLYISAGDGGGGDDQHTNHGSDGNGQSLTAPLGKILRVDPAHKDMKPAGNLGGTTIPWLWDIGMRNPWRFSFDRDTGDMYIGDVGQGKWEELDVEPRGKGNKNYGWRFMEGKHCRGDSMGTALGTTCAGHNVSEFVQPIYDYYHPGTPNTDNCIIGGYVYRGSKIASLKGWYLFGDHGTNHIWALVWNGTAACAAPIDLSSQITLSGAITSFGEDVDGELYITTESGNIYVIEAA